MKGGFYLEIKDLPQLEEAVESDHVVSSISQKTRLISFKNIFEKIAFSSLVTTAKNIIGSINELKGRCDIFDTSVTELNTNNVSNISLLNGATGNLYLQKVGKLIYITGDIVLPDSYNTDASFLLAQIPYKPASLNCFFDAHRGYSSVTGSSCRGTISTDGNIYLYCPAGSIGNVRFSTVFFIA